MKRFLPILLILSISKLIIQFLGNRNYGFHRDELLHLSVSEHLDWGFMEFPPFIGWIGKVSYWLFDYSLQGVRLFPTLAGVVILILCGLMVKELGGKSGAVFLAGICVLAFLPFYRNHTLFQPVAFDQLFWTLGFYFLIRYINTEKTKFLIFLGISLGMGLMNKYTMFVWAFGTFIGLFFYNKGAIYKNKWLYISALVSLLIFLPNLIWQVKNNLPVFRHMRALNENQLNGLPIFQFVLEQLELPLTLVISLIGVTALIRDKNLRKYRNLGISVTVMFFTLWFLKAKPYYLYAIYPVLFAAGSVKIESLLVKNTKWVYVIAAFVFVPVIYFIPQATPILPVETFVKYNDLQEKNGRVKLTGDYADMFGWEEQVTLVDSVYRSLDPVEKKNCLLWAENYGEAGALKILGKKYNLPDVMSRHGSFWSWGYKNENAEVWISLGNEKPSVEYVFEEVELIKIIRHKYAILEEQGIPLYLCRKPKIDIPTWWQEYEEHVFD